MGGEFGGAAAVIWAAYSSNFAGGSGKQREVSKDAMLAEREVRAMRDAERKMGAAL